MIINTTVKFWTYKRHPNLIPTCKLFSVYCIIWKENQPSHYVTWLYHWEDTSSDIKNDTSYHIGFLSWYHGMHLHYIKTRPALERRKTLGHLRSIDRNMIIHFANQSQTCQLFYNLKKKKNFKLFMKRNCEKWCNQSQVENPYRLSRASYKYIYICLVLGITF